MMVRLSMRRTEDLRRSGLVSAHGRNDGYASRCDFRGGGCPFGGWATTKDRWKSPPLAGGEQRHLNYLHFVLFRSWCKTGLYRSRRDTGVDVPYVRRHRSQ